MVSTYQAGKVIVVRTDGGALNTHFRPFAKPMGIAADRARLTIGGANTVWDYRNMPDNTLLVHTEQGRATRSNLRALCRSRPGAVRS